MNQMSFNGELLALPYYNIDEKQAFIAVFDLSRVDYSKSLTTPLLMLGGIYERDYNVGDLFLLNIL